MDSRNFPMHLLPILSPKYSPIPAVSSHTFSLSISYPFPPIDPSCSYYHKLQASRLPEKKIYSISSFQCDPCVRSRVITVLDADLWEAWSSWWVGSRGGINMVEDRMELGLAWGIGSPGEHREQRRLVGSLPSLLARMACGWGKGLQLSWRLIHRFTWPAENL